MFAGLFNPSMYPPFFVLYVYLVFHIGFLCVFFPVVQEQSSGAGREASACLQHADRDPPRSHQPREVSLSACITSKSPPLPLINGDVKSLRCLGLISAQMFVHLGKHIQRLIQKHKQSLTCRVSTSRENANIISNSPLIPR